MNLRDHAIAAARKGFYVFRLVPGTKDCFAKSDHHSDNAEGWNIPSNDPAVVRRMWSAKDGSPRNFNIGIDCSKNLCVFDIDVKDGRGGPEDWKRLNDTAGAAPLTYGVKTPSGGIHFYFATPHPVGNRKTFGKGIDIRAFHGYVVGAGSEVGGAVYDELPYSDDVVPLPSQWLARTEAPQERAESQTSVVELDLAPNVDAAAEWLQAQQTPEFGEGNDTVFKVASHVKDMGISEEVCLQLLLEHFHSRMPGMPVAMVRKIVASSYRGNSQNAPGIATPEHHFADLDLLSLPAPEPKPQLPARVKGEMKPIDVTRNPADHPRRPWVMTGVLLRKDITVLVAPGAAGKSTMTILWSIALALGRSDLVGFPVDKPVKVGLINHEDNEDEFYRRLDAACIEHDINLADLAGKLFLYSGPRLFIAGMKQGAPAMGKDALHLEQFIVANGLDVTVIDPFVATHNLPENDNVAMDFVVRIYGDIAKRTSTSICLVHHTGKPGQASSDGFATSQHSARGASAIVNAARIGVNFFPMSDKDASANGVPPDRRHRYARLDGVKVNFTLGDGQPMWFERVSVDHPNGESVGTLKLVSFENERNREANAYHSAILAAWDGEPVEDGLPIDEVAAKIASDPCTSGKDDLAIVKRLRALFKTGQSDGVYTISVRNATPTNSHRGADWRIFIEGSDDLA